MLLLHIAALDWQLMPTAGTQLCRKTRTVAAKQHVLAWCLLSFLAVDSEGELLFWNAT